MIKAIQKFLFKRKYIKTLQQQIWENDIEIAHQTNGIADLKAEETKRHAEAEQLQADFDTYNASHKKVDRDKAKELAKELTTKKQVIGKYEMSTATLHKNIESKQTNNEYLKGKIKFVKERF